MANVVVVGAVGSGEGCQNRGAGREPGGETVEGEEEVGEEKDDRLLTRC
jgi:hypothetical protein